VRPVSGVGFNSVFNMKNEILQHHPLAELFPMMPAADMTALANDIKANGLHTAIVLYEGKILDGRHRHEACMAADIEPRFEDFTGDDPLAFVLGLNLNRRHMNEAQRAMVAAKIANMKHGGDRKSGKENQSANLRPTRDKAAQALNVSSRSVDTAAKIIAESPKLAKQVSAGSVSLNAAVKQLTPKPKAEPEGEEIRRDKIGRKIPADMVKDWDRADETASHLRSLASEIKVTVERGLTDNDPIFAEVFNHTIAEAGGIHYTLGQITPHALCPTCQGLGRLKCMLCKKRGWISKYLWNSPVVSKETRAIIEKAAAK